MTTTDTKNEYVTDVEHEADCYKSSLYVIRNITQTVEPWIDTYDGENNGEPLAHIEGAEWKFEEQLGPLQLICSMCSARRYVATDVVDTLVALTPDNCPRHMVHHITNYRQPCEYCGYASKGGA